VNRNGSGLQITQFYRIALDPTTPDVAFGASQDNGAEQFQDNRTWRAVAGGDGFKVVVSPTNRNRVYLTWNEHFQRSDDGGATFHDEPHPSGGGDVFNWVVDPTNGNRVLMTSNGVLYESTNGMDSWRALNGSGWPASVNIEALGMSPNSPNTLYVVGEVSGTPATLVTSDDGSHWQRYGGPAGSATGFWDIIQVDPRNSQVAYALLAARGVFRTTNGGQSWTNITGDLPQLQTVALAIDTKGPDTVLYLGTGAGVYASDNLGAHWFKFGTGLPNVYTDDLQIQHYNGSNTAILAAGTYGRGLWEIKIGVSARLENNGGTLPDLVVKGDGNDNQITVRLRPGVSSQMEVWEGSSAGAFTNLVGTFNVAALDSVRVYEGFSIRNSTINLENSVANHTVFLTGGTGSDTFNITPFAQNLNNLQGQVFVDGGSLDTLNINDQASLTRIYTLGSSSLALGPTGTQPILNYFFFHSVTLNGGTATSGASHYFVTDTALESSTTINTGNGLDMVEVHATTGPLTVNGGSAGALRDTILVGNAGSVQSIRGTLTLQNPPSYNNITVDDSQDRNFQTVTLQTVLIGGLPYGQIAGLAPAVIDYKYGDTDSVTVDTGPGGATVHVLATGAPTTLSANLNGINTLVGPDAATTWSVTVPDAGNFSSAVASASFTWYRNLIGGSGDDAFNFSNSAARLSGFLNGGGGNNTLNLSATATSQLINVTGANTGNASRYAGGSEVDFASIQNITASSASDVIVFASGARLSGTLNGGGGTDRLDLTAWTANLTVRLTGLDAGNVDGVVGSFTAIQQVFTGSGDDTVVVTGGGGLSSNLDAGGGTNTLDLSASTANLTVRFLAANNGYVVGVTSFASFQNLTTGGGNDSFVFSNGASLSGTLNGGGGSNVLDLSASAANLTVNVTAANAGNVPGVVGAFSSIQNLTGGSGNNYIAFADGASLYGTLNGGAGGGNTLDSSAYSTPEYFLVSGANAGAGTPVGAFANVQNLIGAGAGGNYFQFADGASLGGSVAGGGGATLDYSLYTTSVVVDLQPAVASATGVGGTVSGVTSVIGGSGAPGTAGLFNLLIGAGGDYLQGGTGRRNILVAGASASTLVGGDGEDLLIGGSTAYDTEAGLANWLAIASYWAGADDFATRSANLQAGAGVPLLDATTVTGNGGGNTLIGTGALALLYTDGADYIAGFDLSSQTVTINP
jgi:hypothetical protein